MKASWEPGDERFPRLHWQLDEESFAAFGRYGVVNELTKGQSVFEKGRPSDALYLVLEGGVAITREGEEVGLVAANHSFGEMGLLLGFPRSADAKAISDARVLELSRADLDRMLAAEPAWAARLYRVLAECLAEYLHKSAEVKPPRARRRTK